jgi:hypothetical protein
MTPALPDHQEDQAKQHAAKVRKMCDTRRRTGHTGPELDTRVNDRVRCRR